MKTELKDIRHYLEGLLRKQKKSLKIISDTSEKFEVSGTIETMQGKKKVDGIYFSTIMTKPKDVRFYFFPAYTHRDQLVGSFSDELKKCLKGKSCFHIKAISDDMEIELAELVERSVSLYQVDGLLA